MQTSHTNSQFAKIELDTSFTRLAKPGAPTISYGPIKYFRVLGMPFPFKYLKAWKPDFVRYVEISGDIDAGPHCDHGIVTSLNCYIRTAGETTQFWVKGTGAVAQRYDGAASENIYNRRNLIQTSSFVAEPGDVYLLDVSQIHSVERPNLKEERKFIQLSWTRLHFIEVLSLIRDTMNHGTQASLP